MKSTIGIFSVILGITGYCLCQILFTHFNIPTNAYVKLIIFLSIAGLCYSKTDNTKKIEKSLYYIGTIFFSVLSYIYSYCLFCNRGHQFAYFFNILIAVCFVSLIYIFLLWTKKR